MRLLPSILLAIIAFGLGTLVLMQKQAGNLDRIFGATALGEGDQIYEFNPRDVGRIEILNSDGTQAVVKKRGGSWITEAPWEDFAEPSLVQSIIEFSSKLVIENVIEVDEVDDLAEFGLRSSKIEVQLYDTGGKPLCHYNIGRYTAWRTVVEDEKTGPRSVGDEALGKSSFPTVVIWPAEDNRRDFLYVCGDRINPALRRIPIRSLFQDELRLLRNHSVFYRPPQFAAEISLRDQNSEIVLTRDSIGPKSKWRLNKPFDLAANAKAIQSLIAQLAQLKAVAVLDESSEALAEPLPENLAQTISLKFLLPDGSISSPTSVHIYPPENENDAVVSAVVSYGPKQKRSAILKLNREELAQLPTNVNDLRSRTVTSLQVAQIAEVRVADDVGRKLNISLKWDPHERAKRWHATIGEHQGLANEGQVKGLFEALFLDEVKEFSDDAAADLKLYGLDQPLRKITLKLNDDSLINFSLGSAPRDHFYARNLKTGRILEVSEAAYQALTNGRPSPELDIIINSPIPAIPPRYDLRLFGLDHPIKKRFRTDQGMILVDFGTAKKQHYYANRDGTPRVAEVNVSALNKMPMRDFKWRATKLWNLSPFEIRGLVIQEQNQAPLQLSYHFFKQEWKARLDGLDVTATLNKNRANRLLEKLTEVRVSTWLGPLDDNAALRLSSPDFSFSVIVEDINDDGEVIGLRNEKLIFSRINRDIYYGKLSTDPSFFIIDAGTIAALRVKLID
ncbi:MAG: DUF4340 domain-containing protein [Akkermansiaceae bacterium]